MATAIKGGMARKTGAKDHGPNAYFGRSVTDRFARSRRQRYGRYGTPWGNVPDELDDHLRRQAGLNSQALRMQAGIEDLPEGETEAPYGYDQVDPYDREGARLSVAEGWELVEEAPGRWIWTGWEDDPQYKAHKQKKGVERRDVARAQMGQDRTAAGPTMAGSGAMSQLQALFSAGDVGAYGDEY